MLGVNHQCVPNEVRKAFRRKALELHPDKNKAPAAETAFKLINEALQTLIDPGKKSNYLLALNRKSQVRMMPQHRAKPKAKPKPKPAANTPPAGQMQQCGMCHTIFLKPAVPHRYTWCPNCSFIVMVKCPTRPGACNQPCKFCTSTGTAPSLTAPQCVGVAPAYATKQGQCLTCNHPCAVTLTTQDMAGTWYNKPAGHGAAGPQKTKQPEKKRKAAQEAPKPQKKRKKSQDLDSESEEEAESSEDDVDGQDGESEDEGDDDEEEDDEELQAQIDSADICLLCQESGYLIVCDGCGKGFHLECLYPPMSKDEVPDDEWFCETCEKGGKKKSSKASSETKARPGAKAVKEPPYDAGTLVWGKFDNFPWWPGQVVELSEVEDNDLRKELHAERDKKIGRDGGCLVRFFGDEDHAWMVPGKILAFREHCTQHSTPKRGNTKGFKAGLKQAQKIMVQQEAQKSKNGSGAASSKASPKQRRTVVEID